MGKKVKDGFSKDRALVRGPSAFLPSQETQLLGEADPTCLPCSPEPPRGNYGWRSEPKLAAV